jgi:flagellar motor protein MotB
MMICCHAYADIPSGASKNLALREKDMLVSSVLQYKQHIYELRQDLLSIKSDKEWLDVRIMTFEASDRPIPSEMINSRTLLEHKQQSKISEINRLNDLCAKHYDEMRRLDAKVKSEHNHKAPDWWSWDEQIYKLMYQETKVAAISEEKPHTVIEKKEPPMVVSPFQKELEKKINDIGLQNWVGLTNSENGLKLKVELPLLFGAGKSTLAKDYRPFIKKLSQLIKPYPVTIDVIGYTGGEKVKAKRSKSILELGTKRAKSVVKEFSKYGISPSLFKISSGGEYGKNDPAKKDLSKAMKRRVDVTINFK